MIRRPPRSTLSPYPTLFRSNRTHLADFERAISPDTAAILKVHPSNYRDVGFTASVGARDLARLAGGRGLDRKSTRLNSSHANISYAVFCLQKTKTTPWPPPH